MALIPPPSKSGVVPRVFAEEVGCCVNCVGRMELRTVVIRPPAAIKVSGWVGGVDG